jgi:hypothetical protein
MAARLRSQPLSFSVATLAIAVLSIATATAGTALSVARGSVHLVWKDGTIHQCVHAKTFATRTLPRGKHCAAHEKALTFNQTGPRGAQGIPGIGALAFSDDNAVASTKVPPGSYVFPAKQTTITMTHPGKLVILEATLYGATINNTTNSTLHYEEFVLVDGATVPGALHLPFEVSVPPQSGPYQVSGFSTPMGVLDNVPAGQHTITIGFVTSDTNVNYLTSSTGSLLVVATSG